MDYRLAAVDDVPLILPMVQAIADFLQQHDAEKYAALPDISERYRGWLVRLIESGRHAIFLAEQDQSPAGMIIGAIEEEIPVYRLKQYGFIHDIWVEPRYRNEGIARQLVTLCLERFKELGVAQVRLDVLVGNAPARNLFGQCGFRESIIEMVRTL